MPTVCSLSPELTCWPSADVGAASSLGEDCTAATGKSDVSSLGNGLLPGKEDASSPGQFHQLSESPHYLQQAFMKRQKG